MFVFVGMCSVCSVSWVLRALSGKISLVVTEVLHGHGEKPDLDTAQKKGECFSHDGFHIYHNLNPKLYKFCQLRG